MLQLSFYSLSSCLKVSWIRQLSILFVLLVVVVFFGFFSFFVCNLPKLQCDLSTCCNWSGLTVCTPSLLLHRALEALAGTTYYIGGTVSQEIIHEFPTASCKALAQLCEVGSGAKMGSMRVCLCDVRTLLLLLTRSDFLLDVIRD